MSVRGTKFGHTKWNIPPECTRRKRGKRGGIRRKSRRRGYHPFMPRIVFGNVRSVVNKIDELRANCKYLHEYREACVIGLVETWLESNIPDSAMDVEGFKLLRCDRNEQSGKLRGGGVALLINELWCNNIQIRRSECTKDYELLTVNVRPFYLPREFTNIFITVLYIPPDANKEEARHHMREVTTDLQNDKPNALHLIFGDLNKCDITSVLHFYQYIDCPTRGDAMLENFLCNIKNSYKCVSMAPLQQSDHIMLHLIPVYKSKLKQVKPVTIIKQQIDETAMQNLDTCFHLTDWNVFINDCGGDINVLTEIVTDYINFCTELQQKQKKIVLYPNNKPWLTPVVRKAIVAKHRAFRKPDYQQKRKEAAITIQKAREAYKTKIEELFKAKDSRDTWRGMKTLTGLDKKKKEPAMLLEKGISDRLNQFYARFDKHNFATQRQEQIQRLRIIPLEEVPLCFTEEDTISSMNKIKVKKASGPDKISGRLIKSCKFSLCYIIHWIFQQAIETGVFPALWKEGTIIPIAKKDRPVTDNDFRPVTLTPVLGKCLERVILKLLRPEIEDKMDPLQFAYSPGKSTNDAICTMIHTITRHLDLTPSNTVRALFIDYSSAFNTIQTHVLIDKLQSLQVHRQLMLLISDYMTGRPQHVKTSSETSGSLILNTGAPQGCCLSPFLFIVYTNDLCRDGKSLVIKYADDTVILGLVENNDDKNYLDCVEYTNNWCKNNFLDLNVSKTKEIVFNFRRNPVNFEAVKIDEAVVEQVSEYKYLGVAVDSKLKFMKHVDTQCKKANSRLYCIRTMKKLNIDTELIVYFFNAMVPSVVMYASAAFYSMLNVKQKKDLDRPRKVCDRLLKYYDHNLRTNDFVYVECLKNMLGKILKNVRHPLHYNYEQLPSGR